MLQVKNKEKSQNNILSVSRNLERPNVVTNLSLNTSNKNTVSKLKQVLNVYECDSVFYITKAAAYSLGFINTRAIMLQESNEMFQIIQEQMNRLKQSDYELNVIKLESMENDKPVIKIFTSEGKMYISYSSAYAIGLVDVESFNFTTQNLYEINENIFYFINNKYKIEYEDLQMKSGLKR